MNQESMHNDATQARPPATRRMQNLEVKKTRKLRQELVDKYGVNKIDVIDGMMDKARDYFCRDMPYIQVYQVISNDIDQQKGYRVPYNPSDYNLPGREEAFHPASESGHMGRPVGSQQYGGAPVPDPFPIRHQMGAGAGNMGTQSQIINTQARHMGGGGAQGYPEDRATIDHENVRHGGGDSGGSNSSSPNKRVIPIRPKEKVFDEWAAVFRHQDEVEKKSRDEEKRLYRERQLKYKQELDMQKMMYVVNEKQSASSVLNQDKLFIKQQEERRKQDSQREIDQKEKVKKQANEFMHVSLLNKQNAKELNERIDAVEKEQFKRQLDLVEDAEKQAKVNQRMNKANVQETLQTSHRYQQNYRREQKYREKELEKQFREMETQKLDYTEKERQKYFQYLKSFNQAGTEKQKLYENYMKGKNIHALAMLDEKAYLEKMRASEKEILEKDMNAKQRKAKEQEFHQKMLNLQIQERSEAHKGIMAKDQEYAAMVKRQLEELERRDQEKKEQNEQVRRQYKENLQVQISDKLQKKKYEGIMSNYERGVNLQDINAYENMDAHLHAKIVGIRNPQEVAHSTQQKYMNRHFQGASSPGSSPLLETGKKPNQGPAFITHNQLHYNQANVDDATKLNQPIFNAEGGRKGRDLPYQVPVSTKDVEMAVRNMQDPKLSEMRHDTFNRAYGGKQSSLARAGQSQVRVRDSTPNKQHREDILYPAASANPQQFPQGITPKGEDYTQEYNNSLEAEFSKQYDHIAHGHKKIEDINGVSKSFVDVAPRGVEQPGHEEHNMGMGGATMGSKYSLQDRGHRGDREQAHRASNPSRRLERATASQSKRSIDKAAGVKRLPNLSGYNIITGSDTPYAPYNRFKYRSDIPEFLKLNHQENLNYGRFDYGQTGVAANNPAAEKANKSFV